MDTFRILEEADDRSKCIVFGYLRETERGLFGALNSTYYTLPQLVYNLCTCYYYKRAQFVMSCEWAMIVDDGRVLNTPYLRGSALGFVIDISLSHYVYRWDLKICAQSGAQSGWIAVGLLGATDDKMEGLLEIVADSAAPTAFNYGTYLSGGQKINKDSIPPGTAYGQGFGDGDTIGLEVNAKERTLAFYKNGECQGVAYRNLPTDVKYRLAVSVLGSLELTDYTVTRIVEK